jgi:hypothetical protein
MELNILREDGPEIGRLPLNSRSRYDSYRRSRDGIRSKHEVTSKMQIFYQVVYPQDTRWSRDRYTTYFEYDAFVRGYEGVKWPPGGIKPSVNRGNFQWQIILGAKLSLNFILELHITIKNNSIHTKIYEKRDDFDFGIVNYPHLDGDVSHAISYGVYVS